MVGFGEDVPCTNVKASSLNPPLDKSSLKCMHDCRYTFYCAPVHLIIIIAQNELKYRGIPAVSDLALITHLMLLLEGCYIYREV